MLFMVIERFHDRKAGPVYRRFRDHGRMTPEGLRYMGSWIEKNFDRCFQLMECEDEGLFYEWITNWRDLMDFEIGPVVPSQEMQRMMFPRV
jgi:hypothetical protein